jgi:hypothetical protein
MGWIYLAELEETPSDCPTTSKLSLIVKQTDTLKLSYYHAWATGVSHSHQYGMISAHSPALQRTYQLILLSGGSPARILALQERVRDWAGSVVVFFTKSCAWPKSSSPLSYTLRTSLPFEPEDWTQLSKNLPKSGMTVAGRCYPLEKLGLPIKENGGLCWPTPTSKMTNRSREAWEKHRARPGNKSGGMDLSVAVQSVPDDGGRLNPQWVEWVMGFPNDWTVLSDWVTLWYQNKPR